MPFKRPQPSLGRSGEAAAERYCQSKGYKILERNYRLRGGEIDLIASDHGTLVFVEVKTRHSEKFGQGELAVTRHKQDQMSKIALSYIQTKGLSGDCRFDVIALLVGHTGDKARLTHYKNAFPLSERYSV